MSIEGLRTNVLAVVGQMEDQIKHAQADLGGEEGQSLQDKAAQLGDMILGTNRPEVMDVAAQVMATAEVVQEALRTVEGALTIARNYAEGL